MSETITASLTVSGGDVITAQINTLARGPAGTGGGGSATWGGITGTLSAQTDLQTALNLKAPLASPALTGTPTAPTAATTTSTTQVATTAFVQQELASGVAVAKNLEVYVRNMTGASMPAGTIVYINGANGNRPTITKAQANSDANSAQTFGFTKTALSDGGFGFVIVRGELENVNTNGLGEGTQLYLSPDVAGNWTIDKPSAPEHLVYVGIVVRDHPTQGVILVAIQNGYELNEIHDVAISSPAAKQVIKRNAGNTLWVNESIISTDVSDSTATGRSLMTAATQSDARTTGLGSGATGDQLFTAAIVKVANETLLRTTKIKTTQTNRTLSATFTTDSDFTIPVTAGQTYRVEFAIYTTATNASGFKAQFTIPSVPSNITASANGVGLTTQPGGAVVALAMTTGGVIGAAALARGSSATNGTYHGFFEVTIGTTGGNLLFQWAQASSSADNTSVLANSVVTAIERTP